MKIIFIVVLSLVLFSACRQPDTDNQCICKDSTGATIIDTIYHMEYDQAYQICEGKEGNQNTLSCDCLKL